jgi:ribonuclease R
MSKIIDKEMLFDMLKNEGKPAGIKYIIHRLKNFGVRKSQIKKILNQLISENKIEKYKNKYAVFTQHGMREEPGRQAGAGHGTAIGKVELKKDFGFVIMPDGKDIFIGRDSVKNLLPGDEVEVLVREGREGKKEGTLKRVIKRTTMPVLAKARIFKGRYEAVPVNKPMPFIRLNEADSDIKEGNTILVSRITERNGMIYGDVISHIGSNDPISAYKHLFLSKYEFSTQFPREVENEASRLSLQESDFQNRKDLRKNIIITVDPADAKDFDDAVSLREKDGKYFLEVHIADVTRYVRENSALDTEARKRSSSIYLPVEVIPMLPEALSNDLCSLREGVDRLAFSIFMEIDNKGEITSYKIEETVINNKKRFTYEQVQDIIDGRPRQKKRALKTCLC